MIIEIDMSKYVHIARMLQTGEAEKAKELIYGALTFINRYQTIPEGKVYDEVERLKEHIKSSTSIPEVFEQYDARSETLFGVGIQDLILSVIEALFDFRSITKFHNNEGEADALALLEEDNNPLASATFYSTDGQKLSKEQFFGQDTIDVKTWMQSYLYAGKYLSHVDLAHYLLLSDFHMVENMQNEHIQALLQVQPALKWQQEHGITLGQRVPGTGFFDLGDEATKPLKECPACKSPEWNKKPKDFAYCPKCYGGGLK